jgi:hypothetical protein
MLNKEARDVLVKQALVQKIKEAWKTLRKGPNPYEGLREALKAGADKTPGSPSRKATWEAIGKVTDASTKHGNEYGSHMKKIKIAGGVAAAGATAYGAKKLYDKYKKSKREKKESQK